MRRPSVLAALAAALVAALAASCPYPVPVLDNPLDADGVGYLVQVAGGTFSMGQAGIAEPVHAVTLAGFRIGQYEVTQAQYESVMGYNPSAFSSAEDASLRPVEQVTWYDAAEFCNRLSLREGLQPAYTITGRLPAIGHPIVAATVVLVPEMNGFRLPSEAQWEYAVRGGSASTYPWGESPSGAYAWYDDNSESETHPVGEVSANAWGLSDMTGNVWEWCQDWYAAYASGAQENPTGPASGSVRVLRGGSWIHSSGYLRSADRRFSLPSDAATLSVGFRVVAPLAGQGAVAAPVFDPPPGLYPTDPLSVTINCATDGASIRYTTDGSPPTSSNGTLIAPGGQAVVGTSPTGTLRAVAFKDGMSTSSVTVGSYVYSVVAAPTLSPRPGFYAVDQVVTVLCATSGASMRYTTDGTDPTTELGDPLANGGTVTVVVSPATTLRVVAYKDGWVDSVVTAGTYEYAFMPTVAVPGGTFTMGSLAAAGEQPTHEASVGAFRMGAFEVTQGQFQIVTGHNPSAFSGNVSAADCPVESLSWFDAVEFCNLLSAIEGKTPAYVIADRVPATGYPITAATVTADFGQDGYRLPTEAQWEYAARAGTVSSYYWGESTEATAYAWYSSNSTARTRTTGRRLPNAFGLYDMAGNVWEWCHDWLGLYTADAQTDPTGPATGTERVARGGSWNQSAVWLRSACRGDSSPGSGSSELGFRVVLPP